MNRELILEYAGSEKHRGLLEGAQGNGSCREPECGDELEIAIKTKREIITEIGYTITETACPPMKACAAIAAELAQDKAVLEAYLLTKDDIARVAGGLDKENIHCAMMAEIALKQAILDYTKRRETIPAEK